MENLHNVIDRLTALKAQSISSDTTTVGETIDRADAESVGFAISFGAVTDGTYQMQVFEGDESDMSDETKVAAANILGDKYDSAESPSEGDIYVFGIASPTKRYARTKIVSASVTAGAFCAGIAELANLRASLATDRNP